MRERLFSLRTCQILCVILAIFVITIKVDNIDLAARVHLTKKDLKPELC